MGWFSGAKKAAGAAASAAIKEAASQHKGNLDFLEAVCAVAALVAAADGDLEESEKRKTQSLIESHTTLGGMYDSNQIRATADRMLSLAKDRSGKAQLLREIDDLKNKGTDAARMATDAYLIGVDVAMADGQIEPAEQVVLDKLAQRMGVDSSAFEI